MEESNIVPENQASAKERKQVERSAAYPNTAINEALEFVGEIAKNFTPNQIINREDIAAVLNKAAATIIRDVSGAVQYGLLIRHKGGYQISSLYKDYCNPLSEKEKRKILLDILKSPKLYQDLIAKFDGHAIPAEVKTHLIRFHNITENAAPSAASIFIENLRFAGILSDNNVLSYDQTYQNLLNPNIQYAEVISEDKPIESKDAVTGTEIPHINNSTKQTYLLPEPSPTDQKLRIPLSGKREAFLQYPTDINEKDIKILLKQIELLELTIE